MPPAFPLLPPRIAGLADIACNLSWSWNSEARALFQAVDELLWIRCRYDPLAMLSSVPRERLAQCAADPDFLTHYDRVVAWSVSQQSTDDTWFAKSYPENRTGTIAYFCAEFGLYHSVPIYSGGLGVLAGDHCKAASDLGVPMVALGILYRKGYFDQRIRIDGWQEEVDDHLDPARTPLEPVLGKNGELHVTTVRTSGRDVRIRVWRLRVGRVPIYLLDTDLPENHADDRLLLSKLYTGGPELRLRQEWLLGAGGVRVLRALGIAPTVWHANEGHVTFMLVERLRELVAAGTPMEAAVRLVRAASTFTTHTPVPAGHDVFPVQQVSACLGPIWDELGVTRDAFMKIGQHPSGDPDSFHMTVAAIRLSSHVNAVSRAHGEVTRKIWAQMWPERTEAAVPIGYVTNGVHLPTWMADDVAALLNRAGGNVADAPLNDPEFWTNVLAVDDADLWNTHAKLKRTLFSLIREEARRMFSQPVRDPGQSVGSGVLLDPGALTIGFARRFATYKRANLIFHDVERLLRIATNPERPVQIIFSGKAHPADTPGKQVLQEVYQTTRDARFEGRIAFVEDYDMHIARVLVQGVDLWLNVPRVPMEASGTSGMKAALNGVPQLSTADGWWSEGANGRNGWTIASPPVDDDSPAAIAAVADQLYRLLEDEVVPAYYERDVHELPRRWIAMMKQSIAVGGAKFTARRMVAEYVKESYIPAMEGDAPSDGAAG